MSLGNSPFFLLNLSGNKMNGEKTCSYNFKSFRLDIEERRLFHNDVSISLEPKVFDVLAVLVERGGHLVEKDELLKIVWADSFVEEAIVARTVYTLRKILGEKGNKQKFIETVAKKGYRFVAEVTETSEPEIGQLAEGSDSRQKDVENFPPTANRQLLTNLNSSAAIPKQKTRIVLFAVGFLSAVFLLVLLSFNYKSVSSGNPKEFKTIAVLPIKPINTTNRDELYEIGIAESLIYKLGSIKGFRVRPLSAIRKYAEIAQDPLAAGKEQQVDYVLAANYQLANGKIKITAQLYNVADGQIEETYTGEKDAGDVFAMQNAISGEVLNKLLAKFAVKSSGSTAKLGTTSEEAYRLYLQWKYLYDKRTLPDARKAIEVLNEAVRLDPNYAQAWAGLAHAHRYAGNWGRAADIDEEYRKSIEAINKALALDANLSEAHSALCENKYFYEYDFEGAERECKRAVQLNSNSSMAHEIYSRHLYCRGRFDEAIVEIKTAIAIEPTSFFNQINYGAALSYARRYDEAVAQYKRVIETEKNPGSTAGWLSITLAFQGKEAEAFEWFIKSQISQKADEATLQAFQTAYQTSGWQGVLREQLKRFDEGNQPYYLAATLNAQIGNKDQAFEYLEKSFKRRELWMAYFQVDPRLDNLRGDPRFDELVRRVEVK